MENELIKIWRDLVKRLMRYIIHGHGEATDKNDIDFYYRLYGKEAVDNRRFYNIGAGSFRHPAWTNIDHASEWYKTQQVDGIGIEWDILSLTPIPIDDNSAEIIYSSNTIEHVTDEAALNMFEECYRILKKGGIFRIVTPNIDLDFRAYKDNDRDYYYWYGEEAYLLPEAYQRLKRDKPSSQVSLQQLFLAHFATSASTWCTDPLTKKISDEELDRVFREMEYEEALNYCIAKCSLEAQRESPGHHMNWWNKNKLFQMLRSAGFVDVYLSGYGQSFCPVLRNIYFFDPNPKMSLYVEAIKETSGSEK